ncbi:MAG TPA: hypothetical protein VN822_05925 [Candidatus Acidoferrales bacterium]|nr:hypothetical protein [Candidatus Acidoferrales bacterium]
MLIREYTPADLDALRRMHARQGFDYAFPDLADPIFVSKLVVEDDDGRAVMASLARLTCEMYLLVDREEDDRSAGFRLEVLTCAGAIESRRQDAGATKRAFAHQRYEWLLALHRAGEQDLLARGLDDAHAWLPPTIARRFGRRLEALGWIRDDAWTPYCRRLVRE